ncbi:UNVERIFIED_CONTAM: hypothetical protein BEN50_20565 [Euhalothece sp. KZN 001]
MFRHHCTPYDRELENGEDRYLATLKAHNYLLEILDYFQENKEIFVENYKNFPQNSDVRWQYYIANLNHTKIVKAIFAENKKRELELGS